MRRAGRLLSLALAVSIVLSLQPVMTTAESVGSIGAIGVQGLSEGNTVLRPALAESGLDGIGICSTAADALAVTPSDLDYRTRVSYEITTPGLTDYDSSQDAVVKFTLENPNGLSVSFDYTICSGSASIGGHIDGPIQGAVVFSSGESEQEVLISVSQLINNPSVYGTSSNPGEFWNGDRVFYILCDNIQNALFAGDRESMTVPVPIEHVFNFEQVYQNAVNTNLVDVQEQLSGMIGVDSVPETPGKYLTGSGSEIKLNAEISGDVRTMIDTGVFTHITMPAGFFLNENSAEGEVQYSVDRNFTVGGLLIPETIYSTLIPVAGNTEINFTPSELEISNVGLGRMLESNAMVLSLDFTFNYSLVSPPVYTCFNDAEGHFLQNQVSFSDYTAPYVMSVAITANHFYFGDSIPLTVTYNEPVYTDNIRMDIDGKALSPLERAGTVSNAVSFLVEVDGDYDGSMAITNITGATDLSGKAQLDSGELIAAAALAPFDAKRALACFAEPTVTIDQGVSLIATGGISVPIGSNMDLSNWLSDYVQEDGSQSILKARVIGQDEDGDPVDVPLYAVTEGPAITKLEGTFSPPLNETGQNSCYAVEFYLDEAATGNFKLLYGLTRTYSVPPVIFIDDASDFEIDYIHWPLSNRVIPDDGASLSLGYRVNVNATWQRPEDFSWSSSDGAIAAISSNGVITLTGDTGTVRFSLTATNAGLAAPVTIYSRTLTVAEAQSAYLYIPEDMRNVETTSGNDAGVLYATNIPERNELFAGSGTETVVIMELYEALYDGADLQKGSLIRSWTMNVNGSDSVIPVTVNSEDLVNTSPEGKYGYILDVSATDLQYSKTFTASANIRVKALPAKPVLARPEKYYSTDDATGFKVGFDIENKNAGTAYLLTVTKNNNPVPVFSTDDPGAIGAEHTVAIDPVDPDRLMDAYTVSLKAKNDSDAAYAYDSYTMYVYNADAMKIMVDGMAADSLIMKPDIDLAHMDSFDLLMLHRKISYTDEISINSKQYKWSNIADKITWAVGSEGHISLKYNDSGVYRDIGSDGEPLFLPGADFLLEGRSSGSSHVTATHAQTGMTATLDVVVDKVEDKLYIFQTYPGVKCEVSYKNGEGLEKTVETDVWGRFAVYEESGIKSDVIFRPEGSDIYDSGVISYHELLANQHSVNDFGLYPQNNVKLPHLDYNVTLELYDADTGDPYNGDVVIRGGAYLNGTYRSGTTINGKSGSTDQTVSAIDGRFTLRFNPENFTDAFDHIKPDDQIKYVIEVSFPDQSHYSKFITIDNQAIRQSRDTSAGVYLKEDIRKLDPTLIQNNVIVTSESMTVDDVEHPISDNFALDHMPGSLKLNMEMMIPGDYNGYYQILFFDDTGKDWGYGSHAEVVESYPFSNTVVLRSSTELRTYLNPYLLGPGEKISLYPRIVKSDGSWAVTLSKPVKIQSLIGIPKMDTLVHGDLGTIYWNMLDASDGFDDLPYTGGDGQVQKALKFLKDFYIYYLNSSIGLEIQSTDDPLVYKGIIRFAAGDYSRDNPSGVFVAGDESQSFSFMPGYGDMKAMSKGNFLKKSKEEMNKSKSGSSGAYKTYGGGAYLESEIYFDTVNKEWKIRVLKSDVYLGGGGGYTQKFNSWVGPVPVTAEFKAGMTAEIGLKTLLDKDSNTRAYITELRPNFNIYGFGGVGFDYDVVALKVGPYGNINHDQRYLWYNGPGDDKNGQKLTISGSTGVEFTAQLTFIEYHAKYEIASASKSWTYNDFDEIDGIFGRGSVRGLMMSADGSDTGAVLEPAGETATFEDRSYLKAADREWYRPVSRIFSALAAPAVLSGGETTILQPNTYPYANPVLTGDGRLMVYLSDMDSTDIHDTAVCFTTREAGGVFPAGEEIAPSDYPDTDAVADGTADMAVAAWTRIFSDIDTPAGEDANAADVSGMLSGTEIMAGVYNDGSFTTTRLTTNNTPDMAPVVAVNGGKAVVAWRSVQAGDRSNPLDFTGRDDILYAVYDGTGWSEARCLYDGSIDHVNALNAAMLSDGTAAITYQVTEQGTENTEIMCAVLDESGNVVNQIRLTDNQISDENPQIASAVFPDGVERFVIGWNTVKTAGEGNGENIIRLSAVGENGGLYPQFDMEIGDTADGGNFNRFRFTKGARNLEDLSVVWTEPDPASVSGTDAIVKDIVWGRKLVKESDGDMTASGKLKLLELDDQNVADFLDTCVDPDTGEISFAMLLSDYSGETRQANLAVATSGYVNNIALDEPDFSYDDILPGLEAPVMFGLHNEGVEPITGVTINLGGTAHVFDDEDIKPGEYKSFTVLYPVPETVENPDYTITAQFETSSDTESGTLRMDVPDVGIERIDVTKELERERGFRVLLRNYASSALKEGIHAVRLEVYDTPAFDNPPIAVETISDGESLDSLNNGLLPVDIALDRDDMQGILDENGEIPQEGAWIYFNTVTEEDGALMDDADISNNMDYVKVQSLISKNGVPVSVASMTESEAGQTVVRVEAQNNSMNGIANGNIIAMLKDSDGRVLESLQSYNPADEGSGLIAVDGEETADASFSFNQTGAYADVIFSRVAEESTLLSVLRMSGVPLDFDKNTYQYDIQVSDLSETSITAAAENPDSVITVFRNGATVLIDAPCALTRGTNTFDIVVKTGASEVTYTVNIQNTTAASDSSNHDSGSTFLYDAGMVIGGVTQNLNVTVNDNSATVNLGDMAAEIFKGDEDVAVRFPSIPGVTSYALEMPAAALSGASGGAALTVISDVGSFSLPSGMLSGMPGLEGKTASITIGEADRDRLDDDVKARIGDRPVVQLTLALDGVQTEWRNPGTPVTVSIPYTPAADELAHPESIVIWYLDGSGNPVSVPNGRYDPATGTVTFSTTHFSDFAVGYNPVHFNDVSEAAYYNKAAGFIAARGITAGTGGGNFSPEAKLTRAEFLVMLMRTFEIAPDEHPVNNFADAGSCYFTGYLAAAKRLDLSSGVGNNLFRPAQEITRQEMLTILCNALEVIDKLPRGDSGKTLSDFSDAGLINPWARDAMKLLVETGTISGNAGKLSPTAVTTRAEFAQVLYNLLQ